MAERRLRWLQTVWQWWKANYPDITRAVGIVTFLYGVFIDRGQNPALLPAATGLVFLKTVLNGKGDS